uniref:LuxR family protein, putative n=1 Tax=Cryptosporidium parvum TaxID=5807 RepID=F0X5H5_CRYPV
MNDLALGVNLCEVLRSVHISMKTATNKKMAKVTITGTIQGANIFVLISTNPSLFPSSYN